MRLLKIHFYKSLLLFCQIQLLVGCTGIENRNNKEIENKFPGLSDRNIEWVRMKNSGESLTEHYHPSAVLLRNNDWYLTQEEIQSELGKIVITERVVLKVYENSRNEVIEVGEYLLVDGTTLMYLTAYTHKEEIWIRQLEVIYEKADGIVDSKAMEKVVNGRDEKWQELVPMGNVKLMVETLFWEEARYYNLARNDYSNTYEELLREYAWIESPNDYSMKTLDFYIVSEKVIYLIGQYKIFGGQGLYTLILTKNEGDVWKNTLDANY